MILKMENITIEQLGQLFQFLAGEDNQKAILSSDDVRGKDVLTSFAWVKECRSVGPEGELPSFNLTLEVKETTRVAKPKEGDPKALPTPLQLLAKLMQSLDLFPEF